MQYTQAFSKDSRYILKLDVTETVNTSDNSSTCEFTISVTKTGGTGYYDLHANSGHWQLTVDGETNDVYGSYDFRGSIPKTVEFASFTQIIPHNADGTKTISVSCFGDLDSTERGTATINQTITLTPIVILAPSYISALQSQKVGYVNNLTVTTITSGATNTMTATCGSTSLTVTKVSNSSFKVNVPFSLLSSTSKSVNVSFVTTTTYNGNVLTKNQTFTFTALDSDLKPNVLSATNTLVGADRWIQGKASAQIDLSISSLSSKYGATMTRYDILIGTTVVNTNTFTSGTKVGQAIAGISKPSSTTRTSFSYTTSVFQDVGIFLIYVRAYDTRGMYDEKTFKVNIVPEITAKQISFGGGGYRLFFKNIFDLTTPIIMSSSTKVLNCTIKEDTQAKATSTFEILSIPSSIEIGDVCGCYDSYKGRVIYSGLITDLDYTNHVVTCQQLVTIFDTIIPTAETSIDYLEKLPRNFITRSIALGLIMNNKYGKIFSGMFTTHDDLTTTSSSVYTPPTAYTFVYTNFYNYFLDWYNSYNVLTYASINPESTTLDLYALNPTTYYTKLTLADNTYALRNFDVTKNKLDANSLVLIEKADHFDSSQLDANRCYFVNNSNQIVRNSLATNIPHRFKQKFVQVDTSKYDITDQSVCDSLAQQNLNVEQYNHQIEFDLVMNNELFDFFEQFKLGRPIDLYIGDKYYTSVISGYSMTTDNEGEFATAHIVCGKARLNLEAVLSHNGITS